MTDDNISRRNFLTGLATTGAAATFVDAQTPNNSSNPVVVTNHPVLESKPGEEVIKIVRGKIDACRDRAGSIRG